MAVAFSVLIARSTKMVVYCTLILPTTFIVTIANGATMSANATAFVALNFVAKNRH